MNGKFFETEFGQMIHAMLSQQAGQDLVEILKDDRSSATEKAQAGLLLALVILRMPKVDGNNLPAEMCHNVADLILDASARANILEGPETMNGLLARHRAGYPPTTNQKLYNEVLDEIKREGGNG